MLKNNILFGFPDKKLYQYQIKEYYNYKEELSVVDDILLKQDRIIVPISLRGEVMKNLHASHLGIEKSLRLARDLLFWPNFSNDIKNMIYSCEICNRLRNNNVKEPMIVTNIPDYPWQLLAADIFTLDNRDYLVIADY